MIKLRRILEETNLYETLTDSMSVGGATTNLTRLWGYDGAVTYVTDRSHPKSIRAIFRQPISQRDFNAVLKNIDSLLGYFPSFMVTGGRGVKYDYDTAMDYIRDGTTFGIYFDAKYDQRLDEGSIPNLLYHASPTIYEEKILKFGLAPKTKNKLSAHPSRIYCAFSLDGSRTLLNAPAFQGKHDGFTVFEINYGKIKNHREIRFFEDPQYEGHGCYTYENIPPQYIKVIERINI